MDVRDAVASRYSCRAFLPTPVPASTIRAIVNAAARAPSGGNLQPWRVYGLAGARLDALKRLVVPRARETPRGEGAEYAVYPPDLAEPYKSRRADVGEQLYASIGIARADKLGRYRQFARNAEFFGAPVALFVTTDRSMGPPQWSDLGMFVQTVMLLARADGLHSCAQEYWTSWHKTVGSFLKLSPPELLFCGIAIGYADPDAVINSWRSRRESLESFATFEGFEDGA